MTRVSEETLKHELRVPLSCGSCTSRCQCLSIHAVIYMPAKLFEMRCLADGRRIVNQLLDDVNYFVEKSLMRSEPISYTNFLTTMPTVTATPRTSTRFAPGLSKYSSGQVKTVQ